MSMGLVTSVQSVVIQRPSDRIQWGMRLRECDRGLYIDGLTPGGAAAAAEYAGALKPGDVITHINEEAVSTDLCMPDNMAPAGVLQLQKSPDLAVRVIVLRASATRATPGRAGQPHRVPAAAAAAATGAQPIFASSGAGRRSVYARLPKRRSSDSGVALAVAVTVNPMFA